MIKLITQQLTNIRKAFNKDLKKVIGIKCTICKGKETEEDSARVKQWTYPWMITGTFVSI
jgi:ribosomal protein L44E